MAEQPVDMTWRDLYAEAFDRFGVEALWSQRRRADPTTGLARAAAATLLREGPGAARAVALRLVEACDAADRATAQGPEGDRRQA